MSGRSSNFLNLPFFRRDQAPLPQPGLAGQRVKATGRGREDSLPRYDPRLKSLRISDPRIDCGRASVAYLHAAVRHVTSAQTRVVDARPPRPRVDAGAGLRGIQTPRVRRRWGLRETRRSPEYGQRQAFHQLPPGHRGRTAPALAHAGLNRCRRLDHGIADAGAGPRGPAPPEALAVRHYANRILSARSLAVRPSFGKAHYDRSDVNSSPRRRRGSRKMGYQRRALPGVFFAGMTSRSRSAVNSVGETKSRSGVVVRSPLMITHAGCAVIAAWPTARAMSA